MKSDLLSNIGITALVLSLWLIQPEISLFNIYLSGWQVASILTVTILIVYLLLPLHYRNDTNTTTLESLIEQLFDNAEHKKQFLQLIHSLNINKIQLPTFILLGTNNHCSKQFLAEAKLTAITEQELIKINTSDKENQITWWISQQGVVLHISCLKNQELVTTPHWQKNCELLKYLNDKCLSGIIIIDDLSNYNKSTNDLDDNSYKQLYTQLANFNIVSTTFTPLYYILKGLEKIDGFNDYYDLTTRSAAFGFFTDSDHKYLKAYRYFISDLYLNLAPEISPIATSKKLNASNFPLNLLDLGQVIAERLDPIEKNSTLQLQGVFFNTDKPQENNFSSAANIFRAISYYVQNIETQYDFQDHSNTYSKWVSVLAVFILLTWSFFLYNNYNYNKELLEKAHKILISARPKQKTPSKHQFDQIVKHLNQNWYFANSLLHNHSPWYKPTIRLPYVINLEKRLKTIYIDKVNQLLPGAIQTLIETNILSKNSVHDHIFEDLYIYMILNRFNPKDQEKIRTYLIKNRYFKNNNALRQLLLAHYAQLKPRSLNLLEPNYHLINELRSYININLLANITHKKMLQKFQKAMKGSLDIRLLLPQPLTPYITHNKSIPFLFTYQGFNKYLNLLEPELNELKFRSWILGKGALTEEKISQLRLQTINIYSHEYRKYWLDFIDSIKLTGLKSRNNALVFLKTIKYYPEFYNNFIDLALEHLNKIARTDSVSPAIKSIEALKAKININKMVDKILASENDQQLMENLESLKTITNNDTSTVKFIESFSKTIQAAIFQSDRNLLINYWNEHIYQNCNKIIPYYPFKSNTRKSGLIATFDLLFKPDGLYDSFIKMQLHDFIDSNLEWNLKGKALNINQQLLENLKTANKLRKYFYRKNSFVHKYKLRPSLLDSRTNQFTLSIGKQLLVYRHGVQLYETIYWPAKDRQAIKYTFHLPGAVRKSKAISGKNWRFHQLIDSAIEKNIPVKFRAGRYYAEYDVKLINKKQYLLIKKAINNFNCIKLK